MLCGLQYQARHSLLAAAAAAEPKPSQCRRHNAATAKRPSSGETRNRQVGDGGVEMDGRRMKRCRGSQVEQREEARAAGQSPVVSGSQAQALAEEQAPELYYSKCNYYYRNRAATAGNANRSPAYRTVLLLNLSPWRPTATTGNLRTLSGPSSLAITCTCMYPIYLAFP